MKKAKGQKSRDTVPLQLTILKSFKRIFSQKFDILLLVSLESLEVSTPFYIFI
jgi:hypothetical protein